MVKPTEDSSEIVEAATVIARALDRLGNADAATPMGAIEGLAAHLGEKIENLASAMNRIADALEIANE